MSTKIVMTLVCTRCSRGSEVDLAPDRDEERFPRLWICSNCGHGLIERGRRLAVTLREVA